METQYASFLIRLWLDEGIRSADWHGELESVQSGKRWDIPALEKLPTILEELLDEGTLASLGRPANPTDSRLGRD